MLKFLILHTELLCEDQKLRLLSDAFLVIGLYCRV